MILGLGAVYGTASYVSGCHLRALFPPPKEILQQVHTYEELCAKLKEKEHEHHMYPFYRPYGTSIATGVFTSILALGLKFEPLRVRQWQQQWVPRLPTRGGAFCVTAAGLVSALAMEPLLQSDKLKEWLGFTPHQDLDFDEDRQKESWFRKTALETMNRDQRQAFLYERWSQFLEEVIVFPVLGAAFSHQVILTNLVAYTNPVVGVGLCGLLHFGLFFIADESNRKEGQRRHIPLDGMISVLMGSVAYLATRRLAVPIVLDGLLAARDIVLNRQSMLPFTIHSNRRARQGDAVGKLENEND